MNYFVTDVYLPDMLYAVTIRSPVSKGKLVSIKCPHLPQEYTLATAKDIPGKNSLHDLKIPILADEKLSYYGEPLALLLGPNKRKLEEYANNCNVIVEDDAPVFSINEDNDYKLTVERRIGNPEGAFEDAASVINNEYNTGIQEHWYSETVGAVTYIEQGPPHSENKNKSTRKNNNNLDKFIVIQTATQWPYHVKQSVAAALNLELSTVEVVAANAGMHLDGKLWYPSFIACHAALGSLLTGKPVRLTLSRSEDFAFSPKRCQTKIKIASAHNEKGDILGLKIQCFVNQGAYAVNAAETIDQAYLGCLGIYNVKNILFQGYCIETNIPPQGPFAGFGFSQGNFAIEQHIGQICRQFSLNPAQWRKNFFLTEKKLPSGLPLNETMQSAQLLDSVLQMSDFERKHAAYSLLAKDFSHGDMHRGIGMALGYQGNGLLHYGRGKKAFGVELMLGKNGSLEINTDIAYSGKVYENIWTEIAMEILGVDVNKVRIKKNSSFDPGPYVMSRYTVIVSRLIEQACLKIRKLRFRNPLPITVKKMMQFPRNRIWEEHFSKSEKDQIDSGSFSNPGCMAAVVETEIASIEYIPIVRGIWLSVDGGKIYNKDNAVRCLKESSVQALGWAYKEQIQYVNGIIPEDQIDNFSIISPLQMPSINVEFINNENEEAKGLGDLPYSCIPSAYMQAVSQTMNHYFQSIPLTALDLWNVCLAKDKEKDTA